MESAIGLRDISDEEKWSVDVRVSSIVRKLVNKNGRMENAG